MRRLLCRRPKLSTKLDMSFPWTAPTLRGGRVDPVRGSIGPVFLFPDRDDFLDPIDRMPAGVEGLAPMRATHGHGYADLTEFEAAKPVNDRHVTHGPALARLLLDQCHLLLGKRGISLVI